MAHQLEVENVLIQIKDKLLKEEVKLWLPPYFVEVKGQCDESLQELAEKYATDLSLRPDRCHRALCELQQHALEKLKERDRFKATGKATLKIRLPIEKNGKKLERYEVLLSSFVSDVKQLVAADLKVGTHRIKLICNGKVLDDMDALSDQGVKNGSQLMALLLEESNTEIREAEKLVKDVENVKADTKLLASDQDDLYMQVEDQQGNTVNLPAREKKALLVAMALHEKGRAAMKKEEHNAALVMFLDADKEFCMCNSEILKAVDNYALLNLDIVWCYLCLENISQLPEAEQRLRSCEENLVRTYGPNLERLIALKGSAENEAALFMRLHLLQAIVMFHQNRRKESLRLLLKAENELSRLKVDQNSIDLLVELDYSIKEARLGLRATQGCVNAAAEFIQNNRKQRKEARKQAVTDRLLHEERKKLGKCADGKQWIEPKYVKMLHDMGYPKEAARVALMKSNNNISLGVQFIQDQPELLDLPGPSCSKSQEIVELAKSLLPQLEAAGFDGRMAILALKKHNGDILKAANELLQNDGIIEGVQLNINEAEITAQIAQASGSNVLKEQLVKEEAFQRLSEGIKSNEEDDYLDLSLEQEEVFLIQYKSLLLDPTSSASSSDAK